MDTNSCSVAYNDETFRAVRDKPDRKEATMENLTYDLLLEACKAGGSSALSYTTELKSAGGEQTLVAPAKYVAGSGRNGHATYVYETRYIDGEPTRTVLIDSRTSAANRIENAINDAIAEGHPIFGVMPRIRVTYKGAGMNGADIVEWDTTLPHRAFDAHIRLGFQEGGKESIITDSRYLAARNSMPAEALGLFAVSPITILLGGWDSTRKSGQARFAASLTGEIIGVLSDQNVKPSGLTTRRSGARIDPVAPSFEFDGPFASEMGARAEIGKDFQKKKVVKGSEFLLGAIPPMTDSLDGISVKRIVRSRVLSFSTLRTLHFGKGVDSDQAIRALLAALAIDAVARADAELCLRANAFLSEAGKPKTFIHGRYGAKIALNPIEVKDADALLQEAYERACEVAGIDWDGQTLDVEGDEKVIAAALQPAEE